MANIYWLRAIQDICAEVVIPVEPTFTEVSVTLSQCFKGALFLCAQYYVSVLVFF